MKKNASQFVVALVCALLGFLLAYQFKLLNKENAIDSDKMKVDIMAEVESLKKEKEELLSENAEVSSKLKALEESAAQEGEVEAQILKQLDIARMHLGTVDVKGPGITLTITPKANIFGGSTTDSARTISDEELVHLTNTLWYAGAEAIQINEFRITPQTGIKVSGNYIWVGQGKIDPNQKIVIKAIGDKAKFEAALNFANTLQFGVLGLYNTEIKTSEDLQLVGSKQTLRTDFVKPVNSN